MCHVTKYNVLCDSCGILASLPRDFSAPPFKIRDFLVRGMLVMILSSKILTTYNSNFQASELTQEDNMKHER